jgi:cyclomaltodextrinase
VEHLANETVAFRATADDAEIMTLLNVGDEEFRFPVNVGGLAVAQTPEPGSQPDDPASVTAHSWSILAL